MYSTIFAKQQVFFNSGVTRPVSFRIAQLKKLRAAVVSHDQAVVKALHQDLRKPEFESFGSEIGVGAFAESSVLIYLRDLLTSIIYFALNGSSDSSGASGLD